MKHNISRTDTNPKVRLRTTADRPNSQGGQASPALGNQWTEIRTVNMQPISLDHVDVGHLPCVDSDEILAQALQREEKLQDVREDTRDLTEQLFASADGTTVSEKDDASGRTTRPDCGSWKDLRAELQKGRRGTTLNEKFGDDANIDVCIKTLKKDAYRGKKIKGLLNALTPESAALLACIYVKSLGEKKISVRTLPTLQAVIDYFPNSLHPDIEHWKVSLHARLQDAANMFPSGSDDAKKFDEVALGFKPPLPPAPKSIETLTGIPQEAAPQSVSLVRTTDHPPTDGMPCTLTALKSELETRNPALYLKIAGSNGVDEACQDLRKLSTNDTAWWRDDVTSAIQKRGENELSKGARALLACMLMIGDPREMVLLSMAKVLSDLPDQLGEEIRHWAPELLANVASAYRELGRSLQEKTTAWETGPRKDQ